MSCYSGDTVPLRQVLPQCVILPPLLFPLCIDQLRSVLLETAVVVTEKELQPAVIAIDKWSASEKMVLNGGKCEVPIFSTNFHEANFQPAFIANNTRLLHNPLPKFLGFTLNRLLTFAPHTQNIPIKTAVRCRVVASLNSME